YFIACTWSQSGIRLFVNDNVYFDSYSEGFKVLDEVIGVGADVRAEGANARPANGLIDELLILPYAASEEEIQRWYVQGLPASGTRVSPVLDLSPVGTAEGSSISWTA